MRHPGVASLAPALRLLSEHGHRITLAAAKVKNEESAKAIRQVVAECPGVSVIDLPRVSRRSGWPRLATQFRLAGNYLRFLEPRYRDAPELRRRAEQKAPEVARRAGRIAARIGSPGVAALRRVVEWLERSFEPPPEVVAFLREQAPDVVLVAHVLQLNGGEADYLRAARRLGLRTAFPVRGWDNLTNKGLIRDAPDLLLVWNDLQAEEAEKLHKIPHENIRVTGAPKCDPLFSWSSRRSREDFCRTVGLRADRPIVLYVCSSPFVAPDEVSFVRSWIEALRARGGPLSETGLLIRPHPLNAAQWAGASLEGPEVCVWPPHGEAPQDDSSRDNYFDSIYHAAAVVGINTTAQIESAILDRPVHTVLDEHFRDTQQGTLHFHYLNADDFGHLIVARTLAEHAAQLEASLRGERRELNERFLRRFVRPLGLDVAATPRLVESIEALAARPAPAPTREPPLAPVARLVLAPFASRLARDRRRSRSRGGGNAAGDDRSRVRSKIPGR